MFSSSVPSAASSLRARSGNQSDALWVNWDYGGGELSGYMLNLYNPNGSLQAEQQLNSEVTEFVFSDLVPGRLYQAVVLTLSGELSNRASITGRTGETTPTFFLVIEFNPNIAHKPSPNQCDSTHYCGSVVWPTGSVVRLLVPLGYRGVRTGLAPL